MGKFVFNKNKMSCVTPGKVNKVEISGGSSKVGISGGSSKTAVVLYLQKSKIQDIA